MLLLGLSSSTGQYLGEACLECGCQGGFADCDPSKQPGVEMLRYTWGFLLVLQSVKTPNLVGLFLVLAFNSLKQPP